MKFGISYAYYQDAKQVRDSARLVESSGYDSLWVTENVHSGPEALEPMVVLSQFAAYTERISIGPAVVLLPLRNPVGFRPRRRHRRPPFRRPVHPGGRGGGQCRRRLRGLRRTREGARQALQRDPGDYDQPLDRRALHLQRPILSSSPTTPSAPDPSSGPTPPSGSAATPRPSSEGPEGGATASSPPTPTPPKPPRCIAR